MLSLLAAGCRGERPPRDYQNNPPAMTHPVDSKSQSPAQHGMPGPGPEPSSGAEGTVAPNQPVSPIPPTNTLGDNAPSVSSTQHATQTTGTAVTGTALARRP
jgi:hypothetical protein